MSETPYVLVIHGTWNGAIDGQIKWYQLDDSDPTNFCYQLNNHLEQAGMGHAVWRNLNGKCITFSWTGANEHAARLQAGQDLYQLIFEIVRTDPTARLYFVAHSHGGNVVLKAIQLYLDDLLRFGAYNITRDRNETGGAW